MRGTARRHRLRRSGSASSASWPYSCSSLQVCGSSASTSSRIDARWPRAQVRSVVPRRMPEGMDRISRLSSGLTGGFGADHILLVAGGDSNGPVEAAANLARDRATVVDIGKIRLDLPGTRTTRRSSTSGSPAPTGQADTTTDYELEGVDYPSVTCDGPRGGISPASSTSSQEESSTSAHLYRGHSQSSRPSGLRPPELG